MNNRIFEVINTRRIEESYRHGITLPQAYPKSIVLDVTNICNYQCPLCPTGSGKSGRPIGEMDVELALQVIDECAEFVECITFGFSGEPLLYHNLLKLISAASQRGVRTKLFTNLSVIPEGGYEALIQAGIDHIAVSLDGVNEQQYSFYRKHGSFKKTVQNIQLLMQANQNMSQPCKNIEAQMLVNKANEKSLEEFVSMCNSLGFDRAKLKYLNLGLDAKRSEAETYLPTDEKLHYYRITKDGVSIREEYLQKAALRICAELYYGPAIIAWNGRYILCCRDQRHETDLGDCCTTSVWDYWNGEKLAEARRLQKEHSLHLCGLCPAAFLDTFAIIENQLQEHSSLKPAKTTYPSILPLTLSLTDVDYSDISSMTDWNGTKKIPNHGDIIDYGTYRTFKY